MLLSKPTIRRIVGSGLVKLIEELDVKPNFIAGTMSAGIPWATIVATKMNLPMVYIRDKPKDHGLMNQIEGLDSTQDFSGAKVIVIEDLISTGGSSAKAVQAVIDAKGDVLACISIFNYGFPEAQQLFAELDPPCKVRSLITYPKLIDQAKSLGYLKSSEVEMLKDWDNNPKGWGEKNGFPKIEK
jgi:orotate phosphoribosyltransferase